MLSVPNHGPGRIDHAQIQIIHERRSGRIRPHKHNFEWIPAANRDIGRNSLRFANAVYQYTPNFADGSYKQGVVDEGVDHVTFEFYTPYLIAATPASASGMSRLRLLMPNILALIACIQRATGGLSTLI